MTDWHARFTEQLQAFSRRRRLVLTLQIAWLLIPGTIVGVELLWLVNASVPYMPAAAILAAILLACGAAHFASRSLASTAALLDSRLALDNRLTAAVQFLASPDPVSLLIVRDASARLEATKPAEVLRIMPPQHRLAWFAAAPIVPLLIGLMMLGSETPADSAQPSAASGAATGQTVAAAVPAGSAAVRQAEGVSSTAARPVPDVSRPEPPTTQNTERTTDGKDRIGVAPQDQSTASMRAVASDTRGRGERSALGAGQGRGAAPGVGSTGRTMRGAGGVQATGLIQDGGDAGAVAPGHPAYEARYRRAWAQAQAAIAREEIPADRRPHVKNYFTGIEPK